MDTLVFDITRGSTNDGPGIRTTVFLKGCPLRCLWCHNPESQSFRPQLSFNRNLCIGCGSCFTVCPNQAIGLIKGVLTINFDKCNACGKCAAVCPSAALSLFGKKMTVDEVFKIVRKDISFYEKSGGGVTLSGGEPLAHPEFLIKLFKKCKDYSIHTCIETSGGIKSDKLEQIAQFTDLFLFDWKMSEDEAAKKVIGSSTKIISENLELLIKLNAEIVLRCPIIPGINDKEMHFSKIAALLNAHPRLKAELLPYHSFGVSKSANIGGKQQTFKIPAQEEKQRWIDFFVQKNITRISI